MNEIKQINKALWEYESSISYRLLTCIAGLYSALLTLWAIEWPTESFLILNLILIGSIFSYYFSKNKYIIVKIIISIFMIISLLNFFENFMTSPLGPAAPVALLLCWLQALHSFDLPSSRDLKYSLIVSFILTVVGAFFISSTIYLIFALIFLVIFGISNFYSNNSISDNILPNRKRNQKKENIILPAFTYSIITIILGIFIGSIFFILLPRVSLKNVNIYNFELFKHLSFINKQKENKNDSSSSTTNTGDKLTKIVQPANGYFGFGESMDLNYRGTLSDDIVMRVKASYPSYYRGGVFTEYDGNKWSIKNPDKSIEMNGVDNVIYTEFFPEDPKTQNIQTFNIEKNMSNIVYTANFCSLLYFPGNQLYMGNHREIFSPYVLEKGMSYTCISSRPKLAKIPFKFKKRRIGSIKTQRDLYDRVSECLQLPEDKISERLLDYSNKFLTYEDDFERALAICEDLKNNYTYDLNVEKFPENAETTDYFLFESKKGFCEHFATAMVVVCRLNGIPSRLVTGFTQGEFNPFSGIYEIKESDAHAWVEVITKHGVIELDPTPSYSSEIKISKNTNIEYLLESMSKNVNKITKSVYFKIIIYVIAIFIVAITIYYIIKNKEKIQVIIRNKKREYIKIETRKKISDEGKKIFKYLSKINIYKEDGQTINEFINKCEVLEDFKSDLIEFFKTYQKLRYSSEILEQDIEYASKQSKNIINKIKKQGRKLWLNQN